MSDLAYAFQIRVTGVLIEKNELLLVKQKVNSSRNWSLPGGRLERGESLRSAIVREIAEETGLQVAPQKLLYVCDVPGSDPPVLHITFLLKKTGGQLTAPTNEFDCNPIHQIKMVPFEELAACGFSQKFIELLQGGFANAGDYVGSKAAIGLDS